MLSSPGEFARICPFCNFRVVNLSSLLSHLRFVHSSDPGFFLTCGVSGCANTYTKFTSFRTHVYRHHKELISSSTTTSTIHESAYTSPIPVISDDIPDTDLRTTMPSHVDISVDDDPLISQQKVSGLFLLKMRETFSVSQAAIDGIVVESESVFEHVVSKLQVNVVKRLSEAGISTDEIHSQVEEVFDNTPSPFLGLTSKYLQEEFYKKTLHLVVCSLNFVDMMHCEVIHYACTFRLI